jgi:hypothetical protein
MHEAEYIQIDGKKYEGIILEAINKLKRIYNVSDFSSGDCGMLAFALGRYLLLNHGVPLPFLDLTFVLDDREELIESAEEAGFDEDNLIDEVLFGEWPIHHVALNIGEVYYDCSGLIDSTELEEWGDAIINVPLSDDRARRAIEWDTGWNISSWDMYNSLVEGTTVGQTQVETQISIEELYNYLISQELSPEFNPENEQILLLIGENVLQITLFEMEDSLLIGQLVWDTPSTQFVQTLYDPTLENVVEAIYGG